MSRHHRKKWHVKLRSFYLWHKYMGVSAAAFVLLISITGLLLNHTNDFEFDKGRVQANWVLDWYGIKAPEQIFSFLADGQYITLMGEDLYLNTREIKGNYHQLTGAILANDMFVVAVNDSILLLTEDGEYIDYLGGKDGVPAGIKQVGVDTKGFTIVQASNEYYQPDADFLHWQRRDDDMSDVRWVTSSSISSEFKAELQHHFRGEVLPTERVLLDLHSGRFFGGLGVWIFDIAAIILILLALSGTWIWFKRKR